MATQVIADDLAVFGERAAQLEHRIEAQIFVAFLAYCLHVTLRARLRPLTPGLGASKLAGC